MPRRETETTFEWMKFYPRDFVDDDAVMAMNLTQIGAYTILLCKAWFERPAGTLPNDDDALARMVGVQTIEWQTSLKAKVMAAFKMMPSKKRWKQKRMWVDARRAREISRARKLAASSRWDDSNTPSQSPKGA